MTTTNLTTDGYTSRYSRQWERAQKSVGEILKLETCPSLRWRSSIRWEEGAEGENIEIFASGSAELSSDSGVCLFVENARAGLCWVEQDVLYQVCFLDGRVGLTA